MLVVLKYYHKFRVVFLSNQKKIHFKRTRFLFFFCFFFFFYSFTNWNWNCNKKKETKKYATSLTLVLYRCRCLSLSMKCRRSFFCLFDLMPPSASITQRNVIEFFFLKYHAVRCISWILLKGLSLVGKKSRLKCYLELNWFRMFFFLFRV